MPPFVVETPANGARAPEDPAETALDFVTRSRGRQLISAAAARFLRHATLDPRRFSHPRDDLLLLLYGMLAATADT